MSNHQSNIDPFITIVIPTYKRPKMLRVALESVIHQSYAYFECIIVNDDPQTKEDVEEIVSQLNDSRLRIIHNVVSLKGGGARNKGIENAKGVIIAFLDDDDQWKKTYLEKHVATHTIYPGAGIVFSGVILKWKDNVIGEKKLPMKPISKGKEIKKNLLLGKINIFTSSAFTLKKEALDKVGFFDKELPSFQDWELCYRISEHYKFKHIEEPLTIFYQHLTYRVTSDLKVRIQGLKILRTKVKEEKMFEKFYQKYLTQAYFTNIKNNVLLKKNRKNIKLLTSYLQSKCKPLTSLYKSKVTVKMFILIIIGRPGLRIINLF